MRLVQLVVHKLDGKATAYELRGHYQNQRVWLKAPKFLIV